MVDATEHRLGALEGDVGKLKTDMYFGDGEENRPMTVRMADVENSVAMFLQNSKDTRSMMKATMFTVMGGILTAFVCYKLGIRI